MTFNEIFTAKTARFVAITIVLGAIGSGAWEWVLKPALTSTSEFGLNVATLGMKNFKDSLYKEVALGFHEESSVRLYIAAFSTLPMFLLGVMTGMVKARGSLKKKEDPGIFDKVMDKTLKPALIFGVFILVFSIVQANQMAYVSKAITHFHVLLRVASPYLGEDQRLQYQSRFSQVSSKEDYEKLITELSTLCKARSLKIPEFSIW